MQHRKERTLALAARPAVRRQAIVSYPAPGDFVVISGAEYNGLHAVSY
jgi:hypothetical protein